MSVVVAVVVVAVAAVGGAAGAVVLSGVVLVVVIIVVGVVVALVFVEINIRPKKSQFFAVHFIFARTIKNPNFQFQNPDFSGPPYYRVDTKFPPPQKKNVDRIWGDIGRSGTLSRFHRLGAHFDKMAPSIGIKHTFIAQFRRPISSTPPPN